MNRIEEIFKMYNLIVRLSHDNTIVFIENDKIILPFPFRSLVELNIANMIETVRKKFLLYDVNIDDGCNTLDRIKVVMKKLDIIVKESDDIENNNLLLFSFTTLKRTTITICESILILREFNDKELIDHIKLKFGRTYLNIEEEQKLKKDADIYKMERKGIFLDEISEKKKNIRNIINSKIYN